MRVCHIAGQMAPHKRQFFCPLPWLHISSRPNGDYKVCCRVQKKKILHENVVAKWYNTPFQKVWNSLYYQSLRQRMLNDSPSEECSYCYEEEARGQLSLRQQKIQQFYLQSEEILKKKSTIASDPIELDLKLSNVCNLSCMMCWPTSSHRVALDIEKILEDGFKDDRFAEDLSTANKIKKNWTDETLFRLNMNESIEHLQHLQFTGGEPLLNAAFFNLLENIVEKGHAKHIELWITTNLTVLKSHHLDIFKKFKRLTMHLSIDGVGSQLEYIRAPLKWDSWKNNFTLLLREGIHHKFFFTVSVYSIFGIIDFLEWSKEHDPYFEKIQMITLFEPDFLNITNLPPEAKKYVCHELQDFQARHQKSSELIQPWLHKLKESQPDVQLINKCRDYTVRRDLLKKQNVQQALPVFAHFYEI